MEESKEEYISFLWETMYTIIDCMSVSICELLRIDESKPTIKYEITKEQYKSRNGYYQYDGDIVCINATIIADCIVDLQKHVKAGCPNGKIPNTNSWVMLTYVLSHELRHREQNMKRRELYENDYIIESKLDFTNEEDCKIYEELGCEIDANAFGVLGSWDLIGTNTAVLNYVSVRENNELFSERLVQVYNDYKDELRPGFMESLAQWKKENADK